MKYNLRLLLFLLFPFLLKAQQRLRFEHLISEEGLSQHAINCMLQDNDGFIWAGTQDGLNRYDGYQFTVFRNDPYNKMSLSYKWILSLAKDNENILWVGTSFGLNRFNTHTLQAERFLNSASDPNTISDNNVSSLLVDKEGLVWIGTDNGLNLFDYSAKKITRFYHLPNDPHSVKNNSIKCIYQDKKGNVWVGTSGGLSYFDKRSMQFNSIENDPDDRVQCIFEDSDGYLWIGTTNGLKQFDPIKKQIVVYKHNDADQNSISDNSIKGILEANHGVLWITTLHGLNIFDKGSQRFRQYYKQPDDPWSLSGSGLGNIFKDFEGNIWIGSGNGINKHYPRTTVFSHYYHIPGNENGLNSNDLWNILEDEEGIVWICTTGGGLNSFDRINNRWTHYKHNDKDPGSIGNNNLWYIAEGSNGKLWITTNRGLDCMDKKTGKFIHYDHDENDSSSLAGSTSVKGVFEDRDGFVWVGTDNGLDKLDVKTGKFKHFRNDPGNSSTISNNSISLISEAKNGKLWVGTFGGGLNLFDPQTGTSQRFVPHDGDLSRIYNKEVFCLYENQNGIVWVGGTSGIDCLDPKTGTATHLYEKDGLPNETIYGIEADNKERLWISTNKGITRYDPKTKEFKYFLPQDGIQDFEFDGFSHFKNKKTGVMFFGGVNGFNIFHPDSIRDNPYKPVVLITTMRRFIPGSKSGSSAPENMLDKKSVTFSYNDNMVSFEFLSLSLSNSSKNKYAYQLKGLNNQWYQLGTRREVTFAGLPPGHYTLLVKTSNSDGVWNDTPAELSITILPPWWKTWWAYTLYAIVFIAALVAFIWYRSKNLKAQNVRLEHKVEIRTNELRQSLENLKATQQQLIQSEKMASLGELTAGIAHEIQNPLNFVNNFSDVNSELIQEMQEEMDKGNITEAKIISNDIKENEEKIKHHGKRADAIVKGMLQHSRSSSGMKEPTDINALCDEYLRLAYHGLRAKDKSFNAEMKTDFDESIGKINIVPQDMGRVILNLINNAFYAVSEKKKSCELSAISYEPLVSVQTRKLNGKIEISVKDNGNGIPESIKEKIFQPFFTTKPTGQGTGLGLSLSYDIVKAHGGEIRVESKEGEGTTFRIQLPL